MKPSSNIITGAHILKNNNKELTHTEKRIEITSFTDATPEQVKYISTLTTPGTHMVYVYINAEHPHELAAAYVGVTGLQLAERHRLHLQDAKKYPDRPLYRYLRENPDAFPFDIATGSHAETNELEKLLRPNKKMGMNIQKGGGSSELGKRRMSLARRGLLWVSTPTGLFSSTENAARADNISKSTVSSHCNSDDPKHASSQYWEDLHVEPCIPDSLFEDSNEKYIVALRKAREL